MTLVIISGVSALSFTNDSAYGVSKKRKYDMIRDYYEDLDRYKGDLSKNRVVDASMTFQFAGNPETMNMKIFNQASMAYYQAFPDLSHSVQEIVSEGVKIMCKVEASGTHNGVFQGVKPTNNPIKAEAISFFEIKGDKLVSQYTCADMLGLMMQIDAIKF